MQPGGFVGRRKTPSNSSRRFPHDESKRDDCWRETLPGGWHAPMIDYGWAHEKSRWLFEEPTLSRISPSVRIRRQHATRRGTFADAPRDTFAHTPLCSRAPLEPQPLLTRPGSARTVSVRDFSHLVTETNVESGTSQIKSGASVDFSSWSPPPCPDRRRICTII